MTVRQLGAHRVPPSLPIGPSYLSICDLAYEAQRLQPLDLDRYRSFDIRFGFVNGRKRSARLPYRIGTFTNREMEKLR